ETSSQSKARTSSASSWRNVSSSSPPSKIRATAARNLPNTSSPTRSLRVKNRVQPRVDLPSSAMRPLPAGFCAIGPERASRLLAARLERARVALEHVAPLADPGQGELVVGDRVLEREHLR